MFNSLTRVGDTLVNLEEVRALVPLDARYTLLLRDGTQLIIHANAAEKFLELAKSSEIVEKARAIVEAVKPSS